jgi:hypothetical protein
MLPLIDGAEERQRVQKNWTVAPEKRAILSEHRAEARSHATKRPHSRDFESRPKKS